MTKTNNGLFSTKKTFEDGSTFDYKDGYNPGPAASKKATGDDLDPNARRLTRGDKTMLWSFAMIPVLIGLVGGASMLAEASSDKRQAEEGQKASVVKVLDELESRYAMKPLSHTDNLDAMLIKADGGLVLHCSVMEVEKEAITGYVHCNGIADPIAVIDLDASLNLK